MKERTESSKYKSPNSGDFCTAEQYIAELVVTNKYNKKNIKLPYKFWNIDKYKKEFVQAIFGANKLTKVYDAEVIIKVLNTTGSWITTLYAKQLIELIETELEKIKQQVDDFNLEISDVNSAPKTFGQKTKLGKLRE